MDIEVFIHGAMCAGISGRCVMSNVLTNRDANRGGCSQICRWDFELLDENKNLLKGDRPFTFCSKDLSMIEYIKDMISIGIKSFKIEGRMRSSYYLATIISVYRKVIDNCMKQKRDNVYTKLDKKILDNCANRDSTPQFYNGIYDNTCSYYNGRVEVSNQDFLGVVLDYDEKTKLATIEERNYFKRGDNVEIFTPNNDIIELKIDKIYDEDNNLIEVVNHPMHTKEIYVTNEGLEQMKQELEDLIQVKRPEVIKALKEARALGDLSENAEYDAARQEQAQTEARIKELESMIEHAVIIENVDTNEVSIGTKVTIEYVDDDDTEEYSIVGVKEADPFNNKISNESPIARAILGKKIGDIVSVDSPNGKYDVKVVAITA